MPLGGSCTSKLSMRIVGWLAARQILDLAPFLRILERASILVLRELLPNEEFRSRRGGPAVLPHEDGFLNPLNFQDDDVFVVAGTDPTSRR